MTMAPSARTVAVGRYWLCAVLRVLGGGMMLYAGGMLIAEFAGRGMSLLEAAAGVSVTSLGAVVLSLGFALAAWLGTLAVGLLLVVRARRIAAWVLPAVGAHCPRCAYSRRGLVSSQPCPECGAKQGE